MRVTVIGAGIGGLTAAMLLHRAGHDVRVFEAAAEIRPLGVGINVQAQGVAVLADLGLLDSLAATAIPTAELAYFNRRGQRIWSDPRGIAAGYTHPQFSIHRGELQMILLRAARERLGAEAILENRRLVGFAQRGDRVVARFVDRAGDPRGEHEGDLLVAADGIHSTVRAHYYPDEGPPRWNGVLMWRGVSEGTPFLTGRSMVQCGWSRQKFVCYPISAPALREGRAVLNWVADLKLDDREMLKPEDWNRPGCLEDFLPRFESWRFGWLDVPAIIRAAQAVYEFPMVDRDPLPRWSDGRVTLLGDAAHPMYPIGSNGATQAILDAAALVRHLGAAADPVRALQAYEAERLPPTAEYVRMNREQGIDRILDLVEARAPDGFANIDDVVPPAELEAIVGKYRAVTGMNAARAAR